MSTNHVSLIKAFNSIDEDAVYFHRTKLLMEKKISFTIQNFSEITIDCDCNVFNAVQMIASDILPSAKTMKKCACGTNERNIRLLEISFGMLVKEGVDSLSSCILFRDETDSYECSKCKQELQETTTLSDMIFIDIQPMTTSDGTLSIPKIHLRLLPATIMVGKNQYHLKGAIEYQLNEHGLSHYVGHCLENDDWIAYNDILKESHPSTGNPTEFHLLVYVKSMSPIV